MPESPRRTPQQIIEDLQRWAESYARVRDPQVREGLINMFRSIRVVAQVVDDIYGSPHDEKNTHGGTGNE